jgi:hypothetical protein
VSKWVKIQNRFVWFGDLWPCFLLVLIAGPIIREMFEVSVGWMNLFLVISLGSGVLGFISVLLDRTLFSFSENHTEQVG